MTHVHDYPVCVEPHLTDYSGGVWHGSYLRWLEEARIDALRQAGLEYANLVKLGCDLPVLKLELSYCRALRMGDLALVKSRMLRRDRVRLVWEQNIYQLLERPNTIGKLALESTVTLAPVDLEKQRIMRKIPLPLEQSLDKLMTEPRKV